MKTNTLLLFLLVLMPAGLYAQIPNPSFEDWTDWSGILKPDGWEISSLEGCVNVIKSSDSHNGSYSVEMLVVYDEVLGSNSSGYMFADGNFPISQRYQSLTGYMKGAVSGSDTLKINVSMWKEGIMIGYGQLRILESHSGWTQFSCGIGYFESGTPDAGFIAMQVGQGMGGNIGSYYRIDELEFSMQTGIPGDEPAGTLTAGPNPAFDVLVISGNRGIEPVSYRLVDLQGRCHREVWPASPDSPVTIETRDLHAGLYLLQEVVAGTVVQTRKVIIRH